VKKAAEQVDVVTTGDFPGLLFERPLRERGSFKRGSSLEAAPAI